MIQQTNSRFITYPSIEPKSSNSHTVLIINADVEDVINIGMFCKVSSKNYDVYLYKQDVDDLAWLSHINANLDCTLIKEPSTIVVSTSDNVYRVGKDQSINNLLDYFQNVDVTPQEI
jgi:hypothetical protein